MKPHRIVRFKINVRTPSFLINVIQNAYLFTPVCGAILETLNGLHLVSKLPAFYGTRMFSAAFPGACHLFLSCVSST